MSDDMKNIVRSAFEGQSLEGAPDSIWSAIDGELTKNEVDIAVKESFEEQHENAPELVWEKVQNQLDIDRVWTRIAGKIQIRRYGYVLRYACAVLLLLIPFALDYDTVTSNSSTSLSGGNVSDVRPSVVASADNLQDGESDVVIPSSTPQNQVGGGVVSTPVASVDPVDEVISETETLSDEVLKMRPLLALNQSHNLQLQPLFTPKPKRSLGLIVGGVSSLDNTWIIDNETRSGFDSESLVDNEISLGTKYGAFAEYQINPRYSVSAEYLFKSRTRQHAHLYDTEGHYTRKEREINSHKLALMATRYSRPKFHGVSHSTLLRFGGYYSVVKNDFTTLDGVITNVNSVYNRNDIGLRMEIGKRIYLKSFVIEGGFTGEYGLANLASFKSKIPPHLNFTRLVSGGAYIRIGYAF